jgi:hypothetical protein
MAQQHAASRSELGSVLFSGRAVLVAPTPMRSKELGQQGGE